MQPYLKAVICMTHLIRIHINICWEIKTNADEHYLLRQVVYDSRQRFGDDFSVATELRQIHVRPARHRINRHQSNQPMGSEGGTNESSGRQRESTNHHPPSGGLSRPSREDDTDRMSMMEWRAGAAVALQVGQGEGGQAADAEALVLPRQSVVSQVDLLVDHWELQVGVLMGRNLKTGDNDDWRMGFDVTRRR